MAEGIITSAQNANAIATIVAKRALARLKAATVAYSIADPSYGDEIASHGNTVNVPIPAEYTTNLLADGGTVTRQQTSLGNAQIVLNKHREITFAITDRNAAITRPDIKGTNLGQAIANFAEAVDEDLLGIYSSLTGTACGAYNTSLTEAEIDTGETTLFNERVPDGLRKSMVLTGTGYSAVRQIARFTEADKLGAANRQIADGFVGRIKGVDVYRDQKTVVTSTNNRHGVMLTPPALLVAVRPLGKRASDGTIQVEISEDNLSIRLTMSYNTETLADQTTLDLLYGFAVGRAKFGLEVKH